jgi:hypothetical protein
MYVMHKYIYKFYAIFMCVGTRKFFLFLSRVQTSFVFVIALVSLLSFILTADWTDGTFYCGEMKLFYFMQQGLLASEAAKIFMVNPQIYDSQNEGMLYT